MLHLDWLPVSRIEFKPSWSIFIRLTKIFTNWSHTIIIIFAVHNLKIMLERVFNAFSIVSFYRIRIDWLSSVPIIFDILIIKCIILKAIWWCFINVFELISILSLTNSLIKILFILCMITFIIFAINYMCSIIKLWCFSISWQVSTIKSKYVMLENFAKVPWSVAELQSLVFSRTAFW